MSGSSESPREDPPAASWHTWTDALGVLEAEYHPGEHVFGPYVACRWELAPDITSAADFFRRLVNIGVVSGYGGAGFLYYPGSGGMEELEGDWRPAYRRVLAVSPPFVRLNTPDGAFVWSTADPAAAAPQPLGTGVIGFWPEVTDRLRLAVKLLGTEAARAQWEAFAAWATDLTPVPVTPPVDPPPAA